VLGRFLRDVVKLNAPGRNFRIFGPDETLSNGLEAVFEATNRQWNAETRANDEFLAASDGLDDSAFDALFTTNKPIIFAFHAYPWLIHRLTYRRMNHANLHVRGYKEEGTITTPFDMTVLNDLDRFHLVMDVIDRVQQTGSKGKHLQQQLRNKGLPFCEGGLRDPARMIIPAAQKPGFADRLLARQRRGKQIAWATLASM
jgi:phosphoketolase